jgi:hypothetical protein
VEGLFHGNRQGWERIENALAKLAPEKCYEQRLYLIRYLAWVLSKASALPDAEWSERLTGLCSRKLPELTDEEQHHLKSRGLPVLAGSFYTLI